MTPEAAAAILDVEVDAAADRVRSAYKLKSRMTHPDRFPGAQATDLAHAQAEFIRIGVARDVLLDLRRPQSQPAAPKPWPAQPTPSSDSFGQAGRTPSSDGTGARRPPPKPDSTDQTTSDPRHGRPNTTTPESPPHVNGAKRATWIIGLWWWSLPVAVIILGFIIATVVDSLNTAGSETELVGTSWTGTDSEGTETTFDFFDDNRVDVTFAGTSYEDPQDSWHLLADGELVISVVFDTGTAIYRGDYLDYYTPIDLNVTGLETEWTLTVE